MLNIIKIIVLGMISTALAVLAEQAVATVVNIFWNQEIVLNLYSHFTWFLAFAAILEEISKFWAIYFVMKNRLRLKGLNLVFGSMLLGFFWGIFEIALIFFSNSNLIAVIQSGNSELIFSLVSMLALHTVTAFVMGIFIATHIFSGRFQIIKILLYPILAHMLFNFLIIQRGGFTNFLIIFVLVLFFFVGSLTLITNTKNLHDRE